MSSLFKPKTSTVDTNPAWATQAGQEWTGKQASIWDQANNLQNAVPQATTPDNQAQHAWLVNEGFSGQFGSGEAQKFLDSKPGLRDRFNQFVASPQSQRISPLSMNEQEASQLARSGSGANSVYDRAMSMLNDTVSRGPYSSTDVKASTVPTGFDAKAYMDPYVESALDPTKRQIEEQYAKDDLTRKSMLKSKGAYGGSRQQLQEDDAARNKGQSISDLYSTGYSSAFDKAMAAYQQDAGRQYNADTYNEDERLKSYLSNADVYNTAANSALNIGNAKDASYLSNIDALMKTGGVARGVDQASKDYAYTEPYTNLDERIKAAGGQPSFSGASVQNSGSPLGQIAGAVAAGVGAYKTSDPRLKEKIRKVGEAEGINVYRFSYIGDDRVYEGVLADEVDHIPDATKMVDGYLAVDYSKLPVEFREVSHATRH